MYNSRMQHSSLWLLNSMPTTEAWIPSMLTGIGDSTAVTNRFLQAPRKRFFSCQCLSATNHLQ